MDLSHLATRDLPVAPEEQPAPESRTLATREQALMEIAGAGMQASAELSPEVLGRTMEGQRAEANRAAAMQAQAVAERLEAVRPMQDEVLAAEGVDAEAKARTLIAIEDAARSGAHPEDIARDTILAQEIANTDNMRDQLVAQAVGQNLQDAHSVEAELAGLRNYIESRTETSIPYVEAGYEMLMSGLLFPRSGGYNVQGVLADVMGTSEGVFDGLMAGDSITEARQRALQMTPDERVRTIRNFKRVIMDRAGILFTNGADADIMLTAVESVFGDRVALEAGRSDIVWGQAIDLGLTLVGGQTIKAVGKGINKAGSVATGGRLAETRVSPDVPATPAAKASARRNVESTVVTDNVTAPVAPAPKYDPVTGTLEFPDKDAMRARLNVNNEVTTPVEAQGVPRGSVADIMAETGPRTSAVSIAGGIDDSSGALARLLGTTRPALVNDFVAPNMETDAIRRGPSIQMSEFDPLNNGEDGGLLNLQNDRDMFSPAEEEYAVRRMKNRLSPLIGDDVVHVAKSVINVDRDLGRIDMDYVVGPGKQGEFLTVGDAEDFAQKRLLNADVDGYEVLRYDPADNAYKPVVPGTEDAVGGHLLRVRYAHQRGSDAKAEDVFKNGANWLTNHVDTTVGYMKRFANSVTALDVRSALAGDKMNQTLRPMTSLSNRADKDAVWRALKEGEQAEVEFTHADLVTRFDGDPKKIKAYKAVRQFYKQVYEVRNFQYREFLRKAGYTTYAKGDGENVFARRAQDPDKIVTVWWEKEQRIVTRKQLEDEGIELEFLETQQPIKNTQGNFADQTDYIAVQVGEVRLQPLSNKVLHELPGYMGRHVDTNYVIEAVKKGTVNGQPGEIVTVARVSDDLFEAEKWKAEQTDGVEYRVRRSAESGVSDSTFVAKELEQMHDYGMLTNTRYRTKFSELDITHQQSLVSPERSLDRVRATMARSVALNQWVDYNTSKWKATYGHLFETDGMPWSGDLKLKTGVPETQENLLLRKKATVYRDKIALVSGVDDAQIGKRIQDAMMSSADWLSRAAINIQKKKGLSEAEAIDVRALRKASDVLRGVSNTNVVDQAKYLGHLSYIVFNPIRQLAMQSGSAMLYGGVEHGSKYYATGAAARDGMFLASAYAARGLDNALFDRTIKAYSQLSGKSVKDAQRMVDDFIESGAMQSVSAHQYVEHGVKAPGSFGSHAGTYAGDHSRSLFAKAGYTAGQAIKGAERSASKVGFEAGEQANRLSAFLAVRNRAEVNGTLGQMTPQQLGVEALQLSGNMGSFNKAAFQQGLLGVPFQFMSHSTRMLQLVMPNTRWTSYASSDILSNAEKAKLGAWSMVMFGADGLGIAGAIALAAREQGIEVEPNVQEALNEGLAGMAMEGLIEAMAGDDANINVSATMGPLNGIFGDAKVLFGNGERAATPLGKMANLVVDVGMGSPPDFFESMGPAGSLVKAPVAFVGKAARIWDSPVFSTGEKLELQMRELARMIPGLNNAFKARIMANTGEYLTNYGTPVAQTSLADALAKGLFGLNPSDVDQYYDARAEYKANGEYLTPPTGRELSSAGKDAGNLVYNSLIELEKGRVNRADFEQRMEVLYAAGRQAYPDPEQFFAFKKAAKKEAARLFGDEQTLVDKMIGALATNRELRAEVGVDAIIAEIEEFTPSPYRDWLLEGLRKSAGQTARFEPTTQE